MSPLRPSPILVGLLLAAACSGAAVEEEQQLSDAVTDPSTTITPATTTARATSTTASDADDTATTENTVEGTATTDAASPSSSGPDSCPPPTAPEGPSVTAKTILDTDAVTVRAAVYPHPDYEGNPWSQWGRGVLAHDGRFLSAIGDHMGEDGNSYFYEFDPETSQLTLVGDVLSVVEHQEGDWGYGKIHGALVRDDCLVYAATYWGSRRGLEYQGSYHGDHLLRWDPSDHRIESLGVPVERQGIP